MKITALYQTKTGSGRLACYFDIVSFNTNGKDCDTPEILAVLLRRFTSQMQREAVGFHAATGLGPPPENAARGSKVLAFYCDRRAKALIERWENPIECE